MEYLTLDIETVPLDITDEHIREYLMDKKISKEQRCFNPNYSKIIVVCAKLKREPVAVFEGDEKKILEDLWNFLKDKQRHKIVTHNGYQFDIPFLIIRSIVNGVKIPISINNSKWQMERSNHFDTMQFFSQQGIFTNLNLDILARLNGIDVPDNRFRGSEIEKLYKEGNLDEIKRHCKEDVELLEKVFEKLCVGYLNR